MAKRRKRSAAPVMIIIFLIILTVAGGGIFLFINASRLMLAGNWTRQIDISDYVISRASDYIKGAAFGDEVDMSEYIGDVSLTANLTILNDGSIEETISEDNYDKLLTECKAGLETAVRDLINRRISDNYIESNMSVDELIIETYGISLAEYLDTYGPKLLPDLDELKSEYNRSGSYVAGRDSIEISFSDEDSSVCNYAVSHGMLVIDYSDGALVYYER